jgi:hypothetical protein
MLGLHGPIFPDRGQRGQAAGAAVEWEAAAIPNHSPPPDRGGPAFSGGFCSLASPRLLFVLRGNPLWFGQMKAGDYFGSLPSQLLDKPHAVPDRRAGVLVFSQSTVRQRAVALG